METSNKRYRVPQDLLMDIMRVLFSAKLRHKIIGIKARENVILLQVECSSTRVHQQAVQNLEEMLQEYSEYMDGMMGNHTLFMDEENEYGSDY